MLVKLTKSTKDIILPAFTHVGNVGTAGETYAYHEEYFKRAAQRYMLPERRSLEAASKSTVTAAEYVRFKWGLDLLRRTVDDAFTDVDVVVAPTVRILPPLLNDMIKAAREGNASITTDIIANTPAVQRAWDQGRDGAMRIQQVRPADGSDVRRAAFLRRKDPRARAGVRAGPQSGTSAVPPFRPQCRCRRSSNL